MTNEELWQIIEEESQAMSGRGIQRRRIHTEAPLALYLGFKKPENQRVFLLRVPGVLAPHRRTLPLLRGVETFADVLLGDEPDRASLGLILREPRYADIFTALVGDMATHIAAQSDDAGAVEAFLARLGKWQKFLENHAEGLGEEAQRGLWGELKFLRDQVLPRSSENGVFAWTGARRTPHDFQFPDCAVEVKTSSAKQLQTLRISNERQLDDTHIETLLLYHLSLEPLRGTGETLPEIIIALRAVLTQDTAARAHFENALLEVGYLDAHAGRYADIGYSIREENLFRVQQGFPRLIEHDLPAGVGEVKYSISVDECRRFAVKYEILDKILQS